MISLKCSVRRVQSLGKHIFVLYFVLFAAIDISYTVDGLSTTNERSMYSNLIEFFLFMLFTLVLVFWFGKMDGVDFDSYEWNIVLIVFVMNGL